MTNFKEWQQLPQTKAYAELLKGRREQIKEEAVNLGGCASIEQLASQSLELITEARVLENIIEELTKIGDGNE